MKKYLRCVQGSSSFTAGKRYEIVNENRSDYSVRNDAGRVELFSKKPDDNGLSYRDWFTLEPEDDNEPITVLPDESLGGVMREYRGIKRKAAVGNRIKVIAIHPDSEKVGSVNIGEVLTVESVDGTGDVWNVKERKFSGILCEDWDGLREYVVLEPSDVLVIDGARYRMVDRKAAVGERVIVTNAVTGYGYKQGGVYEIKTLDCDDPCIWPDGTYESEFYLEQQEYRVLEPVEPQLSALPASDQIAENIAALAARVSGLEAKVAELMRSVIEAGNPAELSVSSEQAETWTKVASGPVNTELPTYLSPQQLRDEIVERAKADVRNLLAGEQEDVPCVRTGRTATYSPGDDEVEFVVNRDKRKVTALIRMGGYCEVWAKGNAICAPNDVFNAAIGRAIALRRALGLDVPAEYLNAPNPEEVRVGDVVNYVEGARVNLVVYADGDQRWFSLDEGTYLSTAQNNDHVITDDSREEVAA